MNKLSLRRALFVLFALFCAMPFCWADTNAVPVGTAGDFATGATLKITWVQSLIIVLVPALIALLKLIVPRIPGLAILTLCPILGAAANWLAQAAGLDVGNPAVGAALGSVGVYLREVIDQAKKSGDGTATKASTLCFCFLLSAFCSCAIGCASFTSTQVESEEDVTRTTKIRVTTVFGGKSELAKLRASTTDKTQGMTIGAASQSSDGSNTVALAEVLIRAAIQAAKP